MLSKLKFLTKDTGFIERTVRDFPPTPAPRRPNVPSHDVLADVVRSLLLYLRRDNVWRDPAHAGPFVLELLRKLDG
jgi:hypothetical protein